MSKKEYHWIPALDCLDLREAERVVSAVARHERLYGFKVGFTLGLSHGLPKVVKMIRKHSDKPIIYDHQKAGTDIPEMGEQFAATLKKAGIDEAILFAQAGPATLNSWIKALRNEGIKVIVGTLMTHACFLRGEGGYLDDSFPDQVFRLALANSVSSFVVPLTKPAMVKSLIERHPEGRDAEFYSPGFGAQGGDPHAFPFIGRHHLIVGRSLFKADDPVKWLAEANRNLEEQNEA